MFNVLIFKPQSIVHIIKSTDIALLQQVYFLM